MSASLKIITVFIALCKLSEFLPETPQWERASLLFTPSNTRINLVLPYLHIFSNNHSGVFLVSAPYNLVDGFFFLFLVEGTKTHILGLYFLMGAVSNPLKDK